MNAVDTIRLIGSVAAESNLAVGIIFSLIRGVRDAWPKSMPGEVLPTDAELIATMRATFKGNQTRNDELQAEILAGNVPAPPEG